MQKSLQGGFEIYNEVKNSKSIKKVKKCGYEIANELATTIHNFNVSLLEANVASVNMSR